MIQGFFIFLLFLGVNCDEESKTSNEVINHENRLRHDLLPNYIRSIIPVAHNDVMLATMQLHLNHFDIDELSSLAILHGQLQIQWYDIKLKWNKEDYGNIDSLHLTSEEVWTPDISLYNGAYNNLRNFNFKGYCKVKSDGLVTWIPQIKFESYCDLDLTRWPYDKQSCSFVLGSWVHHGFQINITLVDSKPSISTFVENHQWKIINSRSFREDKVYACCVEPYPSFTFTFDVERRTPMYRIVLLTPAFCVTMMCLASFWLPPNRGEKIIVIGINIIIVSTILFQCIKEIPAFSYKIPHIVIYYAATFVLLTISMILAIGILVMAKSIKNFSQLPISLKKFFQSGFGYLLCVSDLAGNSHGEQTELKHHFEDAKHSDDRSLIKDNNYQDDWIMFVTGLDRIFFYCYAFIFLILAAICFF